MRHDPARLLPAVLQRMQPKGHEVRSVGADHAEDAALLLQLVAIDGVEGKGGEAAHVASESGGQDALHLVLVMGAVHGLLTMQARAPAGLRRQGAGVGAGAGAGAGVPPASGVQTVVRSL